MIRIYIGYDSHQENAYDVCKYSIKKNSKLKNIQIIPLMKNYLKKADFYFRNDDQNCSTEFAFTRFLVPFLNNYQGWALFCDSDFLWTCDINELFNNLDSNIAVKCVKHDYTPKTNVKMNGKSQTFYPRKNWSSMMVFNCSHPSCKILNLENVNTKPGSWLHRFQWCKDEEIQEVSPKYNCLVGYYDDTIQNPKAIHFTDGGPWHPGYENVKYADLWKIYFKEYIENYI